MSKQFSKALAPSYQDTTNLILVLNKSKCIQKHNIISKNMYNPILMDKISMYLLSIKKKNYHNNKIHDTFVFTEKCDIIN